MRKFLSALPVALALLGAIPVNAGVVTTDLCLPPANSAYLGQYHQWTGPGLIVTLSNPIHSQFTTCTPIPLTQGVTQPESFGSMISGDLVVNGGAPSPVVLPALVSVDVTLVSATSSTLTFDTQMTQLDIDLGGGALIRIDPTTPSTGQTTITDIGGGNFSINSFFDVFTDLSIDGGATWVPSSGPGPGGSTVMTLGAVPEPVSALLIGAGLLAIGVRRRTRKPAR